MSSEDTAGHHVSCFCALLPLPHINIELLPQTQQSLAFLIFIDFFRRGGIANCFRPEQVFSRGHATQLATFWSVGPSVGYITVFFFKFSAPAHPSATNAVYGLDFQKSVHS